MQKINAVPQGNIETYKRLKGIQRYMHKCLDSQQLKVFKAQFKGVSEDIDILIEEIE